MPFLGKQPTAGFATIVKDTLTADGSTTQFTLSKQVASATDIAVFVGNVRQEPTTAYTVNGTTLDFGSGNAPATGLDMYVLHIGGTQETSIVPADGTISSAKLATNIAISGDLDVTGNLDVGTIRHTNGTTALTIDTAGRIQQPTKPAFSVMVETTSSNRNFTSGPQAMNEFSLIEFNIGSHLALNSGIAIFTAPVNGIYSFSSMLQLQSHTTAAHASSYFIIDGVFSGSHNRYHRSINDIEGEDYATFESTALIQLNANQTVQLGIYMNADTTVAVREGTRFMGYLVS